MRNIKYFGKELSVEGYVKKEICKNAGTQSIAFKEQLISLCESADIECNKKMKKEELLDLLVSNGFKYEQLAELFAIGVSSQVYQSTFNISHRDVKRLEKRGILKKVGEYRFRAFGRYNYAPLYDLYQYAQMTDDDMRDMLGNIRR
uniref:Dissimilatory sulfite reductase D n=1 Tax=Siphoviridae sp. ctHjy10 TaxID=2826234 RepID=A0A8S5MBX8_9CAUD|nr:MAG TPA: dissimilatory sulfite reductase D [Siphoviridae sp. ctHjy10]